MNNSQDIYIYICIRQLGIYFSLPYETTCQRLPFFEHIHMTESQSK